MRITEPRSKLELRRRVEVCFVLPVIGSAHRRQSGPLRAAGRYAAGEAMASWCAGVAMICLPRQAEHTLGWTGTSKWSLRTPVTARLSKLFYERLGEQVANELVDWFNQVDASYQADLRELNELNFARFDAKLEQRVAELHAKIDRVAAELNARMDAMVADLHSVLERRLAEQTRWLFVAWASLLMPVMGLWIRG